MNTAISGQQLAVSEDLTQTQKVYSVIHELQKQHEAATARLHDGYVGNNPDQIGEALLEVSRIEAQMRQAGRDARSYFLSKVQ